MNIFKHLLDLLFPQPPTTAKLESMSAADFLDEMPEALEHISPDVVSLFNYKHPLVEQAIWEVKYRGNIYVAGVLGSILYDEIIDKLSDEALFSGFENPLIIPIPLSAERVKERGWNQSDMLVQGIKKKDSNNYFTLLTDVLQKIKHTLPQTKLSRTQRIKNLKGCFAISHPEKIQNKNIILIDDVTTTGSTLAEATRVLKNAGARKVLAFTVGH